MRVKIGDSIQGCNSFGVVVAMSKFWCIYVTKCGREFAERWEQIRIRHDGPDCLASSVDEKNLGSGI